MTRHPIREPLSKAERDALLQIARKFVKFGKSKTLFNQPVDKHGEIILRLLDQVDALEERLAAAQLKTPNQILKCHGTPVSEGADSRGYAQPLNDPRAAPVDREPTIAPARPHPRA